MASLLKNGTVVTMNENNDVFVGDVLIEDNKISKISKNIEAQSLDIKPNIIDATDCFIIPGLIQSHIHLCQTLLRGEADDMSLLNWLEKKVWPMEAAHDEASMQASCDLALLELQRSGTSTILDMASVKHTDAVFDSVDKSGLRYWGGKCLMDNPDLSGPLYEDTKTSILETEKLIQQWNKKTDLINYSLCPRFVISCTQEILEFCKDVQQSKELLVHIHASESLEEIALVKKLTGFDNIAYLKNLGLLNPKSVIVHGVHMSETELRMMIETKTPLVHCPSSNLKLASGIAPTETYRKKNLLMGLGADGAPCNNTLDPFLEVRLAALLQKPQFGPESMPAYNAFYMATMGGAKVLGAENKVGSLEEGKLADICVIDRTHPSVCTVDNPFSAIVYSCSSRDVKHVFINGKQVVREFASVMYDEDKIRENAKLQKQKLLKKLD